MAHFSLHRYGEGEKIRSNTVVRREKNVGLKVEPGVNFSQNLEF
jgi:hypothetical protein